MTKKVADLPAKTKWPDAAPLDGEEMIFSISCGNSHLHWATHFGEADDFNPQIFWRTPHLKEEDMENEDLISVLSRNLPDDPHDHIFGKAADATAGDAEAQSKKRAVPLISVYVVSTNAGQEALLAKIWGTVPSRFYVMRGDDFFRKEEGRYDTMGTDRLATLTGAVHLHGHPALVFDGGTATTYSATDGAGRILGGGIGPGIQSKFRSLTKDTSALPEITPDEVIARVKEAQDKGKPLPTFARNTSEAMMADAFQEFALKGRNVIDHWLDKAYNIDDVPSEMQKVNDGRRVICTGGDGEILMQLLQPHYGGVIEHMESGGNKSRNGSLAPRYIVESSKHLIHYGIACVLAAQVSLRKGRDAFDKNPLEEHVGKRVAKHFEVEADDGDNIFRGKVVKINQVEGGEHEFRIQYDDGDSEDVSTSELFEMFKLFAVYGEKKSKKAAPSKGRSNAPKKKVASPKEKAPREIARMDKAAPRKENSTNYEMFPGKDSAAKSDSAPGKEKATPDVEGTSKDTAPEKAKSDKANPSAEKLESARKAKPGAKRAAIPSFPIKSGRNKSNAAPPEARKPAAKRAKTVNDIKSLVDNSDPRSFVRRRVAKDFDGETYYGTIMEYDDSENPAYWHVEYDDGDEEDYSKKDLIKALKHYEKTGKKDVNKSGA